MNRRHRDWTGDGEYQTLPCARVLIQGNTFPVREELRTLGGRWDAQMKGWWVPKDRAAEARNLVENCEGQLGFDEMEENAS